MNSEYNSKVSSKNAKRMLKNLQNTIAGYFFAAPCTLAVSYIENSKNHHIAQVSINLLLNSKF